MEVSLRGLATENFFWVAGGWSSRETVRAAVQQTRGLHHEDLSPPGPQLLLRAHTMACRGRGTAPLHCENVPLYG